MMFLDCPDYLDNHGARRCGLPAEVRCRFTMSSTDGPLESVMIRCPSGHWFNGPIASLACPSSHPHGPASSAASSSAARASRTAAPAPLDGHSRPAALDGPARPTWAASRPNGAPAYYLGRPAWLWITALTPRRSRGASPAQALAPIGAQERTPSRYGTPPVGTGIASACAVPASTPRR